MFRKMLTVMAICVIASLTGAFATAQTYAEVDARGIPTIAPLLEDVTQSVVNIAVVSEQPVELNPLFNDPFFRRFFDLPETPEDIEPQQRLSAGSGVIVDAAKGYVLTNNHVVANGVDIRVTLKDRRVFDAEIVGTDPGTDIALLQIESDNLTALPMGDSSILEVGDFVVALGNPFGLGQTVTSGIISALDRSGINPQGYEDFIQTDASINPGNSGGALVTLDGKLIGINSAIIAPSGGNVGIGFAVPINMARSIMEQLIEFGEVQRGALGVVVQDVTPDLAEALGLNVQNGAIVSSVEPGSAAEQAGIRMGDVITAVDGRPIMDSSDLRNEIGLRRIGRSVEVALIRNGDEIVFAAEIRGRTQQDAMQRGELGPDVLAGVELAELATGMPGYGTVEGVAVIDVDRASAAGRSGLLPGDVIIGVNNKPVINMQTLQDQLEETSRPVAFTIFRKGATIFLVVR